MSCNVSILFASTDCGAFLFGLSCFTALYCIPEIPKLTFNLVSACSHVPFIFHLNLSFLTHTLTHHNASITCLIRSIKHVPPPWTLKGTVYTFITYISSSSAHSLSQSPSFFHAPLQRASAFANGKPVSGLGMMQIIRYTESPVGPYDEMVIVPGKFEREREQSNMRVTRIYVSQEGTCWNGRKSEFFYPFILPNINLRAT